MTDEPIDRKIAGFLQHADDFVVCGRCGHFQYFHTKGRLVRCSSCGAHIRLDKIPYFKNRFPKLNQRPGLGNGVAPTEVAGTAKRER
jgi:ribosomal protein L37E